MDRIGIGLDVVELCRGDEGADDGRTSIIAPLAEAPALAWRRGPLYKLSETARKLSDSNWPRVNYGG